MTESKKTKKITGIGRIFKRQSNAMDVYIEGSVGDKITLPIKERVKVTWDPVKERLIIEAWDKEDGEEG
jgi:hypothetical protein